VAALIIAVDGARAYRRFRAAPVGEAPTPAPAARG
jgi:hypothetical protein